MHRLKGIGRTRGDRQTGTVRRWTPRQRAARRPSSDPERRHLRLQRGGAADLAPPVWRDADRTDWL